MPNFGDATLFIDNPTAVREEYANKKALNLTIFPNDITRIERPNDPIKFAWCDKLDMQMVEDYQDEGYTFVTDEHFTNVNPVTGRSRWRWDSGKLCASNNLVLMWRPYEEALAAQEAERELLQRRIDAPTDEVHAKAEKAGVESFERRHGKTVVDTAKKRK